MGTEALLLLACLCLNKYRRSIRKRLKITKRNNEVRPSPSKRCENCSCTIAANRLQNGPDIPQPSLN